MDTRGIVVLIMSVLEILAAWLGWRVWDFLTEEWILTVIAVITPILVFLIPSLVTHTVIEQYVATPTATGEVRTPVTPPATTRR